MSDFEPIHPGEIMMDEFWVRGNYTFDELTKRSQVPQGVLEEFFDCQRLLTEEQASALARVFGLSDLFIVNLQKTFTEQSEE